MPNQYKNKVVYYGQTLIDLSDATVTPDKLLYGYTAYAANGQKITGNYITEELRNDVLSDLTVRASQSRNASGTDTVTAILNNVTESGIYYIFQFWNGYLSIAKVEATYIDSETPLTLSVTNLKYTGGYEYPPYIYSTVLNSRPRLQAAVSAGGISARYVYGASIFIAQFPNKPIELVDAIIFSMTLTSKIGRNSPNNAYITTSYSVTDKVFVGAGSYMAYESPIFNAIASNATTNPSLLISDGTNAYLTGNGTSSATKWYGASIVDVSYNN